MGRVSKGIIGIIGGFMIHMVLGTIYIWGNISGYVRSYFCWQGLYKINQGELPSCQNCSLTGSDVGIVFPFMFQALGLVMSFGVPLANKVGTRVHLVIASILLPGGILISSSTDNFWLFSAFYGILFGFVSGIIYMVPINQGHLFFPRHKGMVSGTINSGFGLGALVFSTIVFRIVNSNNQSNDEPGGCYPKDVAEKLPEALQILAGCYFGLLFLGGMLQLPPSNLDIEEIREIEDEKLDIHEENEDNDEVIAHCIKNECPSISRALKAPVTYLTLLQMTTIACLGLLVSANFKSYGQLFYVRGQDQYDDKFLTFTGNIGFVMNSVSRLFWGVVMDYLQFKYCIMIIAVIQILIASTITFITNYEGLYLFYVSMTFMAYGGLYALLPTHTSKIFGRKVGLVVIGIVFQGFTIASWLEYFVIQYGVGEYSNEGLSLVEINDKKKEDFAIIFHSYIAFPVCAFIIAIFVKYNINWGNVKSLSKKLSGIGISLADNTNLLENDTNVGNRYDDYRESLEQTDYNKLNTGNKQYMENSDIKNRLDNKQKPILKGSSYVDQEGDEIGNNYPGYKR